MNNWVEISEPNLTANFRVLQNAAGPETGVLAVIKANAYGHDAETCAPILARAGAPWLGVTGAGEGIRVRRALASAGFSDETPRILILCGILADDVPHLREHRLTPVIWTRDHIDWLRSQPGLPVHLEIDTGMGRQGVPPGAPLAALLREIASAGLMLEGVFTHFCSAEEAHSPLTLTQQRRFEQAVAQVRDAGLRAAWVHAGNSSSLDNPTQNRPWLADLAASLGARAMVRAGLALYGSCLPIGGDAQPHVRPHLQPVLTWKAQVLSVRDLAPGDTVGYNATFTASTPMRVALLPVGYADGLRRELSSTSDRKGGWVMLHGQPAPILGRVSMNLTVVDVSAIPGVRARDLAILLGEGITADDHARLAHTIAYEILCGIHPCG